MGGLVKGVKKVFHAVGNFVKKYWKVVVIAAAVYFTAGIALAYFAPTASFAAAMPGFGAGGIFSGAATALGIGDAANVAAGTGLFGHAVAAGTVAAAGTGAATAAAETGLASGAGGGATLGADAAGLGYGADFVSPELAQASGMAAETATAADAMGGAATAATDLGGKGVLKLGADLATEAAPKVAATDAGFWGGMSGGEKAMLAATAFKGIAGLLQPGPTRAQQGLWPGGAYFGMDEKGQGTNLGAVYKNAMTGSNDSTEFGAESTAQQQAPPSPQQQGVAPLAAGGAQAQQQPQAQQPSPAASAQTGSSFLPSAGTGAASAQQTTSTQADALQRTAQANADFIQRTMDSIDPRKRGNG